MLKQQTYCLRIKMIAFITCLIKVPLITSWNQFSLQALSLRRWLICYPLYWKRKKIVTLFTNFRHLTLNLQSQIHTFPFILNKFNIIFLTETGFLKYCLALQFFGYSVTNTSWWTQNKHVISVLWNNKLNKKQNVANKSICMTTRAPRPSTCN